MTKGVIMGAFGTGVIIEAMMKMAAGVVPQGGMMGVFGLLALAANMSCLVLLMRHRTDDLNMRSTWLCSRNDVMANGGVLLAAAGVAVTGARWPDFVVGFLIAGIFLSSARGVIHSSMMVIRSRVTESA